MLNFVIEKKLLCFSLQKIVGIISGRPKLPILGHVLLEINENKLYITATDLEIESVAKISLDNNYSAGSCTVAGRKFFEICRGLPENSKIFIESKDNKLIIRSGLSRFILLTFPVLDFPKSPKWNKLTELTISQSVLKNMIELTQFSMGYQDVRYYLNGMFFETQKYTLRLLATDGHRLATCMTIVDFLLPDQSIVIPRKGVFEILRLLSVGEKFVNIQINSHSVRVSIGNYFLISKLIDATFPKYQTIFLKKSKNVLEVACDVLQQVLKRVSILSNPKLRIVQFFLKLNQLKITTYNFEQESSEEIIDVMYLGKDMEISFNVDYLLDVLNVMHAKILRLFLTNETSGVQIEDISKFYNTIYIIMPIRI